MRAWLFSLCLTVSLNATSGIVIATCDRYVDQLVKSLTFLKGEIGTKLPIEVWYAGDELSETNKSRLLVFDHLTLHDITTKFDLPAQHFRGFQIKGYLGLATQFDQFIIMDADLFFYQKPEILFEHPGYQETGAFFFCDQESYLFFGYPRVSGRLYHGGTLAYYEARKAFITERIEKASDCLPKKWHFYWSTIRPTPLDPIPSEHLEAGCVVIDRRKHQKGLEMVKLLNENYKETYKYVWGDKETFWLGFEMAHEPYHVNDAIPAKIIDRRFPLLGFETTKIRLVQTVDGKLFYQQKAPAKLSSYAKIVQRNQEKTERLLSTQEIALLNCAAIQ